MSKRDRWWWATAMMLATIGVVWACGPDFPNQLLTDRADTLSHAPANPFAFEAARLVPVDDGLRAHESWTDGASARREAARYGGLDAAQIQQLDALAGLNGEQLLQRGAGLPEAMRLYAVGAAEFRAVRECPPLWAKPVGTPDDESAETTDGSEDVGSEEEPTSHAGCASATTQLARAIAHFQAVLDLPDDQRQSRTVPAAYMLGRIQLLQLLHCDGCDADALTATAQSHFAAARDLARKGAPDPDDLAVASYGEEARLYLRADRAVAAGRYCDAWDFIRGTDCPGTINPEDYARAIGLYAEQTARDSRGGLDSLRLLARYALDHPMLSRGLVSDPVSRQLLVVYVLAVGVEGAPAETRLQVLTGAMQQQDVGAVAGADRLAALAYELGRYDLAASLAGQSSTPLASWVQAKLALHRGDLAAADAAYVQAIKGFPTDASRDSALDADNRGLLQGEYGVLALARGDYIAAMTRLYDASTTVGADVSYEADLQYLAERVLHTDELKAFIDTQVPVSDPPSQDDTFQQSALDVNLRWLLARRLMREGRYRTAQAYFPKPVAGQNHDGSVDLPALAREYAAALDQSNRRWSAIGKAEAWYRAAVLARTHGMELLGYAQDPDYQFVDGNYDLGAGPEGGDLPAEYTTDDERRRYAQTVAQPDRRFHYRYVAADHATRAADLLPPRSQAFAAVLCQATGWMLEGPSGHHDRPSPGGEPLAAVTPLRIQRAEALYRRYVRQGPYVDWAADFGRDCETPDFDRARNLLREQRIAQVRQFVRTYRWYAAGAFVALLAGLGGWVWRRREGKPVA